MKRNHLGILVEHTSKSYNKSKYVYSNRLHSFMSIYWVILFRTHVIVLNTYTRTRTMQCTIHTCSYQILLGEKYKRYFIFLLFLYVLCGILWRVHVQYVQLYMYIRRTVYNITLFIPCILDIRVLQKWTFQTQLESLENDAIFEFDGFWANLNLPLPVCILWMKIIQKLISIFIEVLWRSIYVAQLHLWKCRKSLLTLNTYRTF